MWMEIVGCGSIEINIRRFSPNHGGMEDCFDDQRYCRRCPWPAHPEAFDVAFDAWYRTSRPLSDEKMVYML